MRALLPFPLVPPLRRLLGVGTVALSLGMATAAAAKTPPAAADQAPSSSSSAFVAQSGVMQRIDVKSIRFRIPDTQVVLGETESISLELSAVQPDGKPLDVAPPLLRASTGSLSQPLRTGPGTWTTTFTPPKDRFPHVAILSAQIDTRDGPSVGFASLPLWGKGKLEVATKPNSEVWVFLGNHKFGPGKSGAKGVAHVDILAPPGPERAVAKSTDEVGNESQKTVDLKVPSFNRLAIIPIDEVAAADGKGVAQVLIFLVDKKGVPMFDAPVDVNATVGGLQGDPQGLAPGLFRLHYAPGQTAEKKATLDVALQGKGAEASKASFSIDLLPGGPVRATVDTDVTELSADAPRDISAVVQMFDEAGNVVPRNAGKFDVDVGRIAQVEPLDDNKQRVHWLLPARLDAGAVDATLTVRSRAGDVVGEWKVKRTAGKVATVLAVGPDEVTADGVSRAVFDLRATDAAGNPLSPDAVTVDADGEVSDLSHTDVLKQVAVVFDRVDDVQVAKVRIRSNAEGVADVDKRIRLRPPRLKAKLLAGVGVITDWNFGNAFAAGPEGSFHLRLPVLDGSVTAGVRAAVLQAVPTTVSSGSAGVTRIHTAVPLMFEGQWRNAHLLDDVLPGVVFFAGGGAGLIYADVALYTDGQLYPERSLTTAIGASAFGGAGYVLGPGAIEAELHLTVGVPLDFAYGATPTGLGASIRYRFEL